MNVKEQNRLVGIFLLIHGGLQSLMMLFFVLFYSGIGIAIMTSEGTRDAQIAGSFMIVFALIFLAIFSVFIVPQLVGGWKILKERPNARTWGIIGSIVACMSFPFGTAAGVFGLVFLFGENGTRYYLNGANSSSNNNMLQPPPHNWQ
jgi:glucan phosphoethanolaminetransferase (alkaline phosphatase superfamily)